MNKKQLVDLLNKLPDDANIQVEDAYMQESYSLCEDDVIYDDKTNTIRIK